MPCWIVELRCLPLMCLAVVLLAGCGQGEESAGGPANPSPSTGTMTPAWPVEATPAAAPTLAGVVVSTASPAPSNILEPGPDGAIAVTWDDLYELNFETGERTPKLEALDDQLVKVPGFMVPLDDAAEAVSEFLLVPYAGACVHVPPPPPNQIVYVKMMTDRSSTVYWWDPIWIYGTLHIDDVMHAYGKASYSLDGERTEIYTLDSEPTPFP